MGVVPMQLLIDVVDVDLDRAFTDEEFLADSCYEGPRPPFSIKFTGDGGENQARPFS
jgi:hypothetical protein